MAGKSFLCLLCSIILCGGLQAQDKKIRASLKTDVLNFRNQVVRTKEYKGEQKKAGALAKTYGGPVKITVEIDADTSIEDDEVADLADNMLTGYIKEEVPGESIVAYELHFDRNTKKIIDIVYQLNGGENADNKKEEDK